MNMTNWTYVPEFTKAPNGDILRGEPPKYVHSNGAVLDVCSSSCLIADMLAAEGKHEEAEDMRAMLAGDIEAMCRLLKIEVPTTCVCGSGLYPWWQTAASGRVRVCDRCMKAS